MTRSIFSHAISANARWLVFAIIAVTTLAGCGSNSGPKLGTVSGTVTLEGEPVPDVVIDFSPANGARSSFAITDEQGRYTLRFTSQRKGALPGKHHVRVVPNGLEAETEVPVEEWNYQIPAHYSGRHFLIRDVEPGRNTIDLELKNDPAAADIATLES